MKDLPNYYSIIPASVRYDNRLKANAKLMYGEITALSNASGFCWAQNGYFAKLYNVTKETVSRWITQLKNCGHIEIEHEEQEAGEFKRLIYLKDQGGGIKKSNPHDKKIKPPHDKKIKHNNTSINNIMNKESVTDPKINEEDINLIYAEYPTRCVVSGRHTGKGSKCKDKIKKRLKEGNTKESLIETIKKYTEDCKNTPTYMKNFETFLNNIPNYQEQEKKEPEYYEMTEEEKEFHRKLRERDKKACKNTA